MIFEKEILFLQESIAPYGVRLTPVQIEYFRTYLSELLDWNRKMNLSGLDNPKRITTELFFDSLIPAPFLPEQGKMLDVGSGAGIPGLAIKILRPDLEAHLLEPNSKKNSFLKHIIRLLNLEKIKVIKGKIERDGDQLLSRGYDLITVRALTAPVTAVQWYAPFLKPHGRAIHFLGADLKRPLEQAHDQLEKNGLNFYGQISYEVPENKKKRHIIIFKKI